MLDKEIELAISRLQVPQPIVRISTSWHGGLGFEFNKKTVFSDMSDIDPWIASEVRSAVSLIYNSSTRQYQVRADRERIKYSLYNHACSVIELFLRKHGGSKNNRSTYIYKWYKEKICRVNSPNRVENLFSDIYNIARFIDANSDATEKYDTIRKLLLVAKDRYEPILGSVQK